MTRDQEFVVKMVIGALMLSALSAATYLVAMLVLWVSPGNDTIAAASAVAFFLVGFIFALSWTKRQVDQWWER